MRHPSIALVALLASSAAALAATQAAGRVHLVRSTSGSRGAVQGTRFVMEDPRTTFHAGVDRQVLVSFEWQGPPGRHRCEGAWKDPAGRVVYTSTSEVDARGPRFAVYWGLSLPDTVAAGTWVVEAAVDGHPAGVHAFLILAAPPEPSASPPRRALGLAEIYPLGLAATLDVESLDEAGLRLDQASGLLVSPDLVLTTFAVLNNARRVRVLAPDGRRHETEEVVSRSRRGNWALLRVAGAGAPPVSRAPAAPGIGERCFFLEAQGEGSRAVVEATLTGRAANGDLVISDAGFGATLGAPVLDEQGEVVGMLAAPLSVLGASVLDLRIPGEPGGTGRGGRVRPLPPTPGPGTPPRSLAELAAAGEFVRPLARTAHFVQGILGTGVERQGAAQIPVAQDQRFAFSRREKACVVFVTWSPARKQDSTAAFELFDEDNRKVGESDVTPVKLRPERSFVHYWTIDLPALAPGIYRVDVKLGPDPVWRTFFRVTE
jgi:hypothetical protein